MENLGLVVGLRLDHGRGWDTDELILVLPGGGDGMGKGGHGWWGWSGGCVSHCRYWRLWVKFPRFYLIPCSGFCSQCDLDVPNKVF